MKNKFNSLLKIIIGFFCSATLTVGCALPSYAADGQFSVSPMNQKIVLTPGETYNGSFKVTNPATNSSDFPYVATVKPFYVNNDYEVVYENNGDYNQIVDWISVENPTGIVKPNNTIEIFFTINVPQNAPAGGQYATITVTSDNNRISEDSNINIEAKYSIAHIIYAEIAGTTERQGKIESAEVPSFLLSGDIKGSSTVKNIGNVHSMAKYTLRVFPLFSNEEIYTNEENPDEKIVLPDRILFNETVWDKTPDVGIFNVKYTVEFEGVTTEVSKMVIKCPIWLMFIIIFVVFALIFYFVARAKARKKATKSKSNQN